MIKQTDFVDMGLNFDWERGECHKKGVTFQEYSLTFGTPQEVGAACGDADALIVNQARMDRATLELLPNVKALVRHGDGYEKVDLQAATELGIVCANQPGVWSEEVAEQACMLILTALRKFPAQVRMMGPSVEKGDWVSDEAPGIRRIRGQCLGLLGCGKIGSQLVKKMRGFELDVLVHDPYLSADQIAAVGGKAATFEEVLRQADVVSVHTPLNDATRGHINAAAFALMKPTAWIVNTSRGDIIHGPSLEAALKEGRLGGAALDVIPGKEPPLSSNPLLTLPNVILTAHLGFYSDDALQEMRRRNIADLLGAVCDGVPPRNVLNPDVLTAPQCRLRKKD